MRFERVIEELAATKGVMACGVVDYENGMFLEGKSPSGMDLDVLSAGNTEIVRSEVKGIERLYEGKDNTEAVEDILITLQKQYYLLRPMRSEPGLFMFLVLDRNKANLALSRRALKDADRSYKQTN
ncbi:hypothetical protein PT286_02025 [Neisseriaceae bacterium ESL0693]|nr:hypothetical protein [Neisseriaceae bacterium ESL0693]